MSDTRPIDHPPNCACPRCIGAGPEPGDVVRFAFPAPGGRVRPVASPCLGLGVEEHEGHALPTLAPGVPAAGRRARSTDLHAPVEEPHAAQGLDRPHLILGCHRPGVPPAHPDLERDGAGSATLGRPSGGDLESPEAPRARLRDQGERAAGHRRRGWRGAVRGRDFVVEHRRPRRRVRPGGGNASGAGVGP